MFKLPSSQMVLDAIQKTSIKHGSISPLRIQTLSSMSGGGGIVNQTPHRYSSLKKHRPVKIDQNQTAEQDYYENHFKNLPS
jgi:hypothetical protein